MNKKCWEEVYKTILPTPFAKFCRKFVPKGSRIVDLGCGNGRDSFYFADHGKVTGIDFAVQPYSLNGNPVFKKIDIKRIILFPCHYDVVYSRFFLHSIAWGDIQDLIMWTNNLFMAEFRDERDKPKIFKDHKRTAIKSKALKECLETVGFEVLYYKTGRNMAKYRGENPLVTRIIARRLQSETLL